MIWTVLGMIGFMAGIVVMVLGKVLFGLILLMAGLCSIIFTYAKMMRGAGYLPGNNDPDSIPGHHASERTKMDQPVVGEQNSAVWEKMEQ